MCSNVDVLVAERDRSWLEGSHGGEPKIRIVDPGEQLRPDRTRGYVKSLARPGGKLLAYRLCKQIWPQSKWSS